MVDVEKEMKVVYSDSDAGMQTPYGSTRIRFSNLEIIELTLRNILEDLKLAISLKIDQKDNDSCCVSGNVAQIFLKKIKKWKSSALRGKF